MIVRSIGIVVGFACVTLTNLVLAGTTPWVSPVLSGDTNTSKAPSPISSVTDTFTYKSYAFPHALADDLSEIPLTNNQVFSLEVKYDVSSYTMPSAESDVKSYDRAHISFCFTNNALLADVNWYNDMVWSQHCVFNEGFEVETTAATHASRFPNVNGEPVAHRVTDGVLPFSKVIPDAVLRSGPKFLLVLVKVADRAATAPKDTPWLKYSVQLSANKCVDTYGVDCKLQPRIVTTTADKKATVIAPGDWALLSFTPTYPSKDAARMDGGHAASTDTFASMVSVRVLSSLGLQAWMAVGMVPRVQDAAEVDFARAAALFSDPSDHVSVDAHEAAHVAAKSRESFLGAGTMPALSASSTGNFDVKNTSRLVDDKGAGYEVTVSLLFPQFAATESTLTPFTWYILLKNPSTTPVTVTELAGVIHTCPQGFVGERCSYKLQDVDVATIVPISPSQSAFVYQRLTPYRPPAGAAADAPTSWSIGVAINDLRDTASTAAQSLPTIFLRRGAIPILPTLLGDGTYDVIVSPSPNPALFYSSPVVSHSSDASDEWFITYVFPQNTSPALITWFNSDCPHACSGHGTCQTHVDTITGNSRNTNTADGFLQQLHASPFSSSAVAAQSRVLARTVYYYCQCDATHKGADCSATIDPTPPPPPTKQWWDQPVYIALMASAVGIIALTLLFYIFRACLRACMRSDEESLLLPLQSEKDYLSQRSDLDELGSTLPSTSASNSPYASVSANDAIIALNPGANPSGRRYTFTSPAAALSPAAAAGPANNKYTFTSRDSISSGAGGTDPNTLVPTTPGAANRPNGARYSFAVPEGRRAPSSTSKSSSRRYTITSASSASTTAAPGPGSPATSAAGQGKGAVKKTAAEPVGISLTIMDSPIRVSNNAPTDLRDAVLYVPDVSYVDPAESVDAVYGGQATLGRDYSTLSDCALLSPTQQGVVDVKGMGFMHGSGLSDSSNSMFSSELSGKNSSSSGYGFGNDSDIVYATSSRSGSGLAAVVPRSSSGAQEDRSIVGGDGENDGYDLDLGVDL